MPMADNHHVKTERAAIRDKFAAGVSEGVDAPPNALRGWVADIYATRGPYDRGYLLGVLLEEWSELEDVAR